MHSATIKITSNVTFDNAETWSLEFGFNCNFEKNNEILFSQLTLTVPLHRLL